nr:DNA methyltransferase [Ferrimicrobium acidiphilum]
MTEIMWDGKYDAEGNRAPALNVALPFQIVETVNESTSQRQRTLGSFSKREAREWKNRLIWGDNKYVLPSLIPELEGRIDLIYIDPPFATGSDFSVHIKLETEEFDKEASIIEQKAYRDTWGKGFDTYLKMIGERLALMRHLLKPTGSIFVHLDATVVHYVKVLLDEVYGLGGDPSRPGWRSEIIWFHNVIGTGKRVFPKSHETILWYSKGDSWFIDPTSEFVRVPYSERITETLKQDSKGWYYVRGNRDSSGNVSGKWFKTYVDLDDIKKGKFASDVWDDIKSYRAQGEQSTGFPTQKPEKLIERIVGAFSREGDLVADFFCGSGTTLAVAEKLHRRWIGCDISRFAVHISRKRLLAITDLQPFVVENLGKYERQLWQTAEFGKDAGVKVEAYRRFILKLYRAEPTSGFNWVHGIRGNRFVHVGSVDGPVTSEDVRGILEEFRSAFGSGNAVPKSSGVDILGWDFGFELNEVAKQGAAREGVDLRFKRIPRDILDVKAIEQGDVKFFELAALSSKVSVEGLTVRISLTDFTIPPDDVPEEVRRTITHWIHWVDYWAIDWDNKGDAFHNEWQSFRSREEPVLRTKASHTYSEKGTYSVVVKVIDILGNDTTKSLQVKVG